MTPQKVLESIQQARNKARAEYDKATGHLIFTKDFQTRQEAVMHDPLATVGERVMAWILRRSWGEYRLYAVREDGEPAFQRDCVRELGISKKRVSTAVSYFQKRGYLEDRPKLLYPVISPTLTTPKKVTDSGNFSEFMEEWKVTNSADFEEEKVLRSSLEKKIKVRLAAYKKWQKQKRKAAASLLETERRNPETDQRAVLSPFEKDNLRHQEPAQDPVDEGVITQEQAENLLLKEIGTMQKSHPNTPFAKPAIDPNNTGDVGLVKRILREVGSRKDGRYDEQHLIGFLIHISAQFKGYGLGGTRKAARDPASPTGPKSLGLLVNWAQDYARINGHGYAS